MLWWSLAEVLSSLLVQGENHSPVERCYGECGSSLWSAKPRPQIPGHVDSHHHVR